MGHQRGTPLPRTRKWKEVIAFIENGATVSQVASATIIAAQGGLGKAGRDLGVVEAVYWMMQLPLAACSDDFAGHLRGRGMDIDDAPGLMDLTSALTEAIDKRISTHRQRTDLGEMAQMSLVETINSVIGPKLKRLFETVPEDVQDAFANLATPKQFGSFAKEFYSRFTFRCLNYFVSKEVANHIGEGRRFLTMEKHGAFIVALAKHCSETAKIIEEYSGDWFSKWNWETQGDITREKVSDFNSYAMTKLIGAIQFGEALHV